MLRLLPFVQKRIVLVNGNRAHGNLIFVHETICYSSTCRWSSKVESCVCPLPSPWPHAVAFHTRDGWWLKQFKNRMEIEVADPWFSLLQKGIKTVEGRKGGPKWKALSEGDAVIFSSNDGRRVHARVVQVRQYETMDEFLETERMAALPGIISVEEAAAVYWQWWSPEEVNLLGILAIEVKIR